MRFRSLQSRITALYSATFGLVMLLVAITMQWAIADSAEDKVSSELVSSAAVIDRIWTMRSSELESVARPLALDFGFREAVATDDDETIRSALANIASRIDLPNAFVVKYDGRVVAMQPGQDRAYDAELWDQLDSGWQSGALRLNGATFQAVAAEIKAPALIGWLVLGRELDAREMKELNALSAVPVKTAVIRRTGGGVWVYDASGKPVNRHGIAELLGRMKTEAMSSPENAAERLDGSMVLVRPLGASNGVASTALNARVFDRRRARRVRFPQARGADRRGARTAARRLCQRAARAAHRAADRALEQAARSLERGQLDHAFRSFRRRDRPLEAASTRCRGHRPAREPHPPHGLSRRADRPAQPLQLARRSTAARRASLDGGRARGAVPRPRQLQDHQRHARPQVGDKLLRTSRRGWPRRREATSSRAPAATSSACC
jgi:hypothetical protein